MSIHETKPVPLSQSPSTSANGQRNEPAVKRRESILGKVFLILVCAGGAAGAIYEGVNGRLRGDINWTIASARRYLKPATVTTPLNTSKSVKTQPHWNGFVAMTADQAAAVGVRVVKVVPQLDSIRLELTGRTDYDPNSLTKIRPRFDTLVEHVHAELGQKVEKGAPLVDLFSTKLAAAKNDFQTAYVQWQHDLRLLEMRERLFKQNAIAEQQLVDTRNDESKSRLVYFTARETLVVLGVPEEEIDPLTKHLRENPLEGRLLNGAAKAKDKAKMTRLSPVDGIIISRDVVPGNLYDTDDVLLVIAPLDHLFVWANVYERDQAKVAKGQRMEIRFPFLLETILGTVEYVSNEVSKDTRAIKVRASIPNLDGGLKADMLVSATLEIPPRPGQTRIPRLAMVVMNGKEYAFVRRPRDNPESKDVERFERHQIAVEQENNDFVVVSKGLKPGDEVASNGSLFLSQLHEDQQMVESGTPAK